MIKMLEFRGLVMAAGAAMLLLAGCDSGAAPAPGAAPKSSTVSAPGQAGARVDWTKTVVATPEGGWRIGNPDAKVSIVEFASFSCGACKAFHDSGKGPLFQNYVETGKVSFEFRPFMLNVYDFAATLMATCETPAKSAVWADELYGNYDSWVGPFAKLGEAEIAPLRNLPADQQVRALAEAGGLHNFARARGMAKATFDACMMDQTRLQKKIDAQQVAQQKFDIQGTPTFLINGKKADGTTWAQIEPQIKAALG